MDEVRVKSKVGNFNISRRTQHLTMDGTIERYEMKRYDFSPDFITALPRQVWEELSEEYLDRNIGLRYREALRTV